MRVYLYKVLVDGKVVFVGDRDEVCDYTGMAPRTLHSYIDKGCQFNGRYRFEKNGFIEKTIREEGYHQKKKPRYNFAQTKELTEEEYLVQNLRLYNNAFSINNPEKYIPVFEENGFKINYHKSIYGKGYILEVANAN